MSSVKEPGYFLARGERHPAIRTHTTTESDEFDRYLSLFNGRDSRPVYMGESSTGYTHLRKRTGVAERIHRFNSRARLIYAMRDPVDRTISHYWWNVRFECERRDILTAISNDPHYRDVSNYVMQLKEWLKYFDRSAVYVVTLEELSQSPVETLSKLLGWLGVDESFAAACVAQPENETPKTIEQPRVQLLQRLRYSRLWERLGPSVPRWCRTLGRRMAVQPVERHSVDVSAVEAYLRPLQQSETEELSDLLGRPFPEWRMLNGTTSAVSTSCAVAK
jgi:hypothetical protein